MSSYEINALVIVTPEGVSFSLPLAGPVTRFFAWVVDMAVISLLTTAASVALTLLAVFGPDLMQAVTIITYFAISIGYGIVMEWYWRGKTIGKHLLGLRVVDEKGLRVRISQIVIRNLLRFVDSLPAFYLVGGLAALLSPRFQRLGDYAANTVVVRPGKEQEYVPESPEHGKYNSFRNYPHLAARLRSRATPEEADLVLQALNRRNTLEPEARVKLMKELADHFRSLVSFPEDAAVGITDERYVINVADILYQSESKEGKPRQGAGS